MDLEGRKSAILLAVLDEERRKALSYVPKADVDAFAGLYAEAHMRNEICKALREQGHDVPDWSFQTVWLDEELNIGQARNGWRAKQVVDVERAAKDPEDAPERQLQPGGASGWK